MAMLGSELKNQRLECGLSQEQCAEFLGIDRGTLIKYERSPTAVPQWLERACYSMHPGFSGFREWFNMLTHKHQRMVQRRAKRYAAGAK